LYLLGKESLRTMGEPEGDRDRRSGFEKALDALGHLEQGADRGVLMALGYTEAQLKRAELALLVLSS
jgi:hypothetical protein